MCVAPSAPPRHGTGQQQQHRRASGNLGELTLLFTPRTSCRVRAYLETAQIESKMVQERRWGTARHCFEEIWWLKKTKKKKPAEKWILDGLRVHPGAPAARGSRKSTQCEIFPILRPLAGCNLAWGWCQIRMLLLLGSCENRRLALPRATGHGRVLGAALTSAGRVRVQEAPLAPSLCRMYRVGLWWMAFPPNRDVWRKRQGPGCILGSGGGGAGRREAAQ